MTLAAVRGDLAQVAFPFLLGAAGFLLLIRSGQLLRRFPGTDFERSLDRLFALLFPAGKATPTVSTRAALTQQLQLAELRRSARRWGKELQLITTDGYETASRISALCVPKDEQGDRALLAEAMQALRTERATAGADLTLADDTISMLAYGLGARPAKADLTSLENLLTDLGLAGERNELRTHFDDVVAARTTSARLSNDAQRSMFRDLAGASFVLGASRRILELASRTTASNTPTLATATGQA
jgi:hypothetical protein